MPSADIEADHLEELRCYFANLIAKNEPVIFIVPKESFMTFTIQLIIDSKERKKKRTKYWLFDTTLMKVHWIEQYVMEVDVTPMVTAFEESTRNLSAKGSEYIQQHLIPISQMGIVRKDFSDIGVIFGLRFGCSCIVSFP